MAILVVILNPVCSVALHQLLQMWPLLQILLKLQNNQNPIHQTTKAPKPNSPNNQNTKTHFPKQQKTHTHFPKTQKQNHITVKFDSWSQETEGIRGITLLCHLVVAGVESRRGRRLSMAGSKGPSFESWTMEGVGFLGFL